MEPEIYGYTNYRQWLSDYHDARKVKQRGFSYRLFSMKAGFSSPNFIRMVVQGKRNLAVEGMEKIADFVGLKKREADFFKNLVLFNQAATADEKNLYFEKLGYFKAFTEIRKIDQQQYDYFSHWYYPVIREMANLKEFRADPNWISKVLSSRITPAEALEALKVLESLGFLKPDKNKRLKPAMPALTTAREVINVALWNFHNVMIDEAKRSLEKTPAVFRDVSSITIAIDRDTLDNVKEKLNELRQELLVAMSKAKSPDAVYQLNFQFFNLTAIPPGWVKEK